MKTIAIEDLPAWSPWPARLLGLSPWTPSARSLDKVLREYDQDKYARCLEFLNERGGNATPEEVRNFETGGDGDRKICVSMGDELYAISLKEAGAYYENLLSETLGPELGGARTAVELGAGWGYNLWILHRKFPQLRLLGGELSGNAVALAERLFRSEGGPTLRAFNFYDPSSYDLVARAEPPVVVFTSFAVEQLDRSRPLLEGLRTTLPGLASVVHFESIYDPEAGGLLGLFRRKYTEMNDYNRDLLSELSSRRDLTLEVCRKNVFGQNPLHPASILKWRFL